MPLPTETAQTSTIAFVDVVESVRHLQRDERDTIERMRLLMHSAAELVQQNQGQVIERLGDGLVLRFDSVRDAVRCTQALHELARREGGLLSEDDRLQLRAGIHVADVWADASGTYGLGVSLAARIAATAQGGETWLSVTARDRLPVGFDCDLRDMGPCYLKHIEEPVRLFCVQAVQPLSESLRQAIAARLKTKPILAVLPFLSYVDGKLLAQNTVQLADIVSQQVTAHLSLSPMLHVISGPSCAVLRGVQTPLAQVFKALGADYLLLGHVMGAPTQSNNSPIAVQVQLWRKGAAQAVWTQHIEATAVDALSAQSQLLGQITQAVGQHILSSEQRLARGLQALPNLSSHTLYLSAVDLLHRFSLPDFERAGQMLVALSERAPRHPEPLAWLARWHVFRVVQGWSDNSAKDSTQALSFSERALDRDPDSSLALTMAGSVHAGVKGDPQTAQALYEKALHTNPNESMAWVLSPDISR